MENNKKTVAKEQQPLLDDVNVIHEDTQDGMSIHIEVNITMNDTVVDIPITSIKEYLRKQFELCNREAVAKLN